METAKVKAEERENGTFRKLPVQRGWGGNCNEVRGKPVSLFKIFVALS